jgi:hypothetical protein
MVKLTNIHVSLKIPFTDIGIEGDWAPDERERQAAWELYVELVTRVALVPLRPLEGSLGEALSSLYSLFATTRTILRTYGPAVAQPKGDGSLSFGYLAVAILNLVLRPVLAKWHPLLLAYESGKGSELSAADHERQWERNAELRRDLEGVHEALRAYAAVLAEVAGVPPLLGSP